jgi:ribosomal-protein-alanine N-acetyltransferase
MRSLNGIKTAWSGVGGPLGIEPMTLDDVPEVCAIEQVAFSNPWSKEAFRHEIEKNPYSLPTVARTKRGEIVGYYVIWLVFEQVHIQNIATHPDYRRRGIGRYLLVEALDRARKAGARQAQLEVRESNTAARDLYVSMGFEEIGQRKGYYSRPREDAVLYQKDLLVDFR